MVDIILPTKWNSILNRGNYTIENKFGLSTDIDNSTFEDVWSYSDGNLTYLDVAENMNITSASNNDSENGNGARSVQILGVNNDWEMITENITLNGITPVTTTQTFLRVYRVFVNTTGVLNTNTDEITIRSATSNLAQAHIPAKYGQSQMTHFTVPAKHTAYITTWHGTCGRQEDIEFRLLTRQLGGGWRTRRTMFIYQGSSTIPIGVDLPEKTDVRIEAKTVTGTNRAVSSFYQFMLANIVN